MKLRMRILIAIDIERMIKQILIHNLLDTTTIMKKKINMIDRETIKMKQVIIK